MSSPAFIAITLLVALVLGGAASAMLWTLGRRRQVMAGGLKALAGMRWREFSRFVIEALQGQGFEASRETLDPGRGQQADLLLTRDGRDWLLSCKQGLDYRIDSAMVSLLARAVHDDGAAGGILATLGRVQPDARRHSQGIELLDGAQLWPLIDPLLPPSVHEGLAADSHRWAVRATVLAGLVALLVGAGVAAVTAPMVEARQQAEAAALAGSARADTVPAAAPAAAADPREPALDESPTASVAEQRRAVIDAIAQVRGVERTGWATQSTLVVRIGGAATTEQTNAICAILERHDALRSSRVQLQPPDGSPVPVRFMQCATF